MLKYLFKKAILIRILIIILFCFLAIQLIQSLSRSRVNVSNTSRNLDEPNKLVNGKWKDPSADVNLVDLKALPPCPKTFYELFGNSMTFLDFNKY